MAAGSLRRQLAAGLGELAREIALTEGDLAAQTSVYSAFLGWWNGRPSQDAVVSRSALDVLSAYDRNEAFEDFVQRGDDPAVHFYEDFLRAYDPAASKRRGVHYSPGAVVSYILRGVRTLLREQFPESAESATILDPCCGIGTFLRAIPSFDVSHRRVIGMEVSAAACALAARLAAGCELITADSLQEMDLDIGDGPLVVIGNPPYSGHSANAGAIAHLLADYKAGLTERNPKWLQDDYVKFIRMAQHRIDCAGRGILAFITNHSYLVNPTFRAMRDSLMSSFDQVYALDLYGNALANPQTEESDENVFPIRMGVAIAFMLKCGAAQACRVMHAGISGSRTKKLETLARWDFHDTPWEEVAPSKPFSLFVPANRKLQDEFYSFASLFDLFGEHSVGFVTSRDSFAVDIDREALLARIGELSDPRVPLERIRERYEVTDLNLERARRELLADPDWESKVVRVLYRPFDTRWTYYSRAIMERPRLPFMENMMQPNVAICIGRAGQVTGSSRWDVVFCADSPVDLNLFRRGGAMIFPLYSYSLGDVKYNLVQENAEFFYYIYALLHSSTYRSRYADFLAIDYPRIPLAPADALLSRLAELGQRLVDLHLLRACGTADAEEIGFRIGGWDVPGKYLKDRRGRLLGEQERKHIARINYAVRQTLALQQEIDLLLASESPLRGG